MDKVMLIYPPGKAYQRGEDRAQCNIEDSATTTIRACNDLGYAASVLRNRGYDVFLKDYQTEETSYEQIENDIKTFSPDILLISTTNATIPADIGFIDRVKEIHSCEYILKGAIFFDIPQELLDSLDLHNVNYLIGGEVDAVIGDLADCICRHQKAINEIPMVIYRDGNKFIKNNFDCWCTDLDAIPFPARDLMNNALYIRPDTGEPMATIQVARGCPASCIYCLTPIISGKAVRKRSVDNILAEIEDCYYNFNIKNFFFKADTFTIDAQWAEELCDKIINSELWGKIEFTANSRVKPLSENLLKKLKQAGCFMLAVGFESGSDNTLAKIKKGSTVEDSLRAAKMIKKAKLPLFGFFMIGFPWETEEDILNTLNFMFEIDPDFIELHIAMPYFGTELYSQCSKYGTIKSEAWGNDYFSPNTTGTQAVSIERIIELRKKYLLKFYLRPKYIFKKAITCTKNPKVLKNYFKHGLRLLKTTLKK
jgi:radical SAM superfamily enzyme YgiQ (UPF0313 family)